MPRQPGIMLGMHFITRLLVLRLRRSHRHVRVRAERAANQAQLRLVVVDQTGAGIPAATVTVKPATGEPIVFVADDHGVASSPALVPGAVTVQVEFPGFMPFEAPLTLKRGAMNETVTLEIEGFKAEVEVSQASAPRGVEEHLDDGADAGRDRRAPGRPGGAGRGAVSAGRPAARRSS